MQKTAYELRISDWSSDVCSSDLVDADAAVARTCAGARQGLSRDRSRAVVHRRPRRDPAACPARLGCRRAGRAHRYHHAITGTTPEHRLTPSLRTGIVDGAATPEPELDEPRAESGLYSTEGNFLRSQDRTRVVEGKTV